MSLDQMLSRVVHTVPQCVAAGYVDMTTGMLMGVKTVDSHPQEVLDLVAAATADMFRGPNVSAIEKLFRQSRGQREDGARYFKEYIVTSENLVHLFLRAPKRQEEVLIVVSRVSANLGMVLSKSRSILPEVEASL